MKVSAALAVTLWNGAGELFLDCHGSVESRVGVAVRRELVGQPGSFEGGLNKGHHLETPFNSSGICRC